MNQLTVGQVVRSIQRFKDYADDFVNADMNTYDDRSAVFFDFCQIDPAMSVVHAQLTTNPNVDFEKWHADALSKMSGWAGSAPLKFPTNTDDRISLMYQLLLAIEEGRINFLDFCIKFIVSGDNSYDSYIACLSEAVTQPLVRELEYKLDEILETLPDADKKEPVPQSVLQIINASGPVVQQVAIGNNNIQTASQTIGNPEVARLLVDLKREIQEANIEEDERASGQQVLASAEQELASPEPKKPVVSALLKALPIAGSIATIVQALLALL